MVVIGVDWRDRLEPSMTVESKTETELTQCCELTFHLCLKTKTKMTLSNLLRCQSLSPSMYLLT